MAVAEGEVERGQQAGVLGEIVGLDAKELGEFGEDVAVGVLDEGSEARGAGIAAGAAIAVGGDPGAKRGLGCQGKGWEGWNVRAWSECISSSVVSCQLSD